MRKEGQAKTTKNKDHNNLKMLSYFYSLLLSFPLVMLAQPVYLHNPSFEDKPEIGRPPEGWYSCGTAMQDPPDINPHPVHGVVEAAWHGSTYVGLVTRADSTQETIGQRLTEPLQKGHQYELRVYVRRSPVMRGFVGSANQDEYLTDSCVLRVGGSQERCKDPVWWQMSPPVAHTDWQPITLSFTADHDTPFLLLSAYFSGPVPTYANIQLDQVALFDVSSDGPAPAIPTPPPALATPTPVQPAIDTLPPPSTPAPLDLDEELMLIGPAVQYINRDVQSVTYPKEGFVLSSTPNSGCIRLLDLLQAQPGLQLAVGIRVRTQTEYRLARKKFLKEWERFTNQGDPDLLLFERLKDDVQETQWTYHDPAALYWLRWVK